MAYSIALPDLPFELGELFYVSLPSTVGCQTAAPEIPVVLDDVFGVVPTTLAFAPVAIATAQANLVQVVTKVPARRPEAANPPGSRPFHPPIRRRPDFVTKVATYAGDRARG